MIIKKATGTRRVIIAVSVETDSGDVEFAVDPAVNLDDPGTDLKAYEESLWDTKHLRLYPGEKPTYFDIKAPTKRQKDRRDVFNGMPREAVSWDIRCGLKGVQGYFIEDDDGDIQEADPPALKKNGMFGEMVTERYVNKLDLPFIYMVGLALMIRRLGEAQVPLSRQSGKEPGRTES